MYPRITHVRVFLSVVSLLAISSCGGGGGGSAAPNPPPPPPPPPPPTAITIALSQVFDQVTLQSPVAFMQAPGDSTRWFVIEQAGIVKVFPNNPNVTDADVSIFVDIRGRVVSGGERGLLGMAFHPNFGVNNNFEVFLSYTRSNGGQLESVVSRFRSINSGATLDTTMEDIILSILQDNSNHNGGQITFGPDGNLYAGWGDGGGSGDPFERAQDTRYLLGSMTRIDVDGAVPYAIPAGNPFAANAANRCIQGFVGSDCPEIYAWGLRNPWRWSFDRQTGELWVGDVGQGAWEEVDRIQAGENYGWDEREGAHCFEPAAGCSTSSVDPITEYSHSSGQSITGGYVYRGAAIPELQGSYVYGDFVSGRIWAVPATSQQGAVGEQILTTTLSIASFAEDNDGEIYVINYAGEIYQFTDAP